ncbi:MAG TPA: efflux RND transporter periplasmic adaptor subunit [Gemmatimonadaceae bacterium]|nr:efflux RND transporter periplasmic adaptor subunit [Gemmatimonadaceae bacterium]
MTDFTTPANGDAGTGPTPASSGQPAHDPKAVERAGRGRRHLPMIGAIVLLVIILVAVLFAWRRRHAPTSGSARAGMAMPRGDGHPMAAAHPGSTSNAAGMAGMAGMQMSSAGTVQLTANQLRQFGVTFGTVAERMLDRTVRTVGTVIVDETRLSEVTPRFGGYVEHLYVNATGQRVHAGDPLMAIYSPELVAAEQELLLAGKLQQSVGESSVPGVPAASTNLVAAAKRRFALWGISDAQVNQILRSGQVQRTLTLHAPASGVVLEKHVVQGQAIRAGEMLYRIADLRDVWIGVALREQDAGAVRVGSRATVELEAYPGQAIDGRVAYVYPTVDSAARTVRARVQVPNARGRLKPGMYATVTLVTPARRALTVPTSAVVNTGARTLVFMDMGGGQLMPMEVVTGRVTDANTEVLSGVQPGQRVVTSAQYLLDSESNLAEVMKSMIGQMGTADMQHMSGMQDVKGMQMPPSPTTPRR